MSDTPAWASTFAEAVAAAGANESRFAPAIRHGSLLVGLYSPAGVDPQQPHHQDEVYIVATGSATFVRGDERIVVGPGDALFVPARMDHRFEAFSDDFTVWVVFYGPQGGESPA